MTRSTGFTDEEIAEAKRKWSRLENDPEELKKALASYGPEGMRRIKNYEVLSKFVESIARRNGLLDLISPRRRGKKES